jgi:hypothetical protein
MKNFPKIISWLSLHNTSKALIIFKDEKQVMFLYGTRLRQDLSLPIYKKRKEKE